MKNPARSVLLCLVALGLCGSASAHDDYPSFNGSAYQEQSAADKERALWNSVLKEPQQEEWYAAWQVQWLYSENMNTTFTSASDDMPVEASPRLKLIHTVGAVAPVVWKSTGKHPYTGLFQGASQCLVRLSLMKAEEPFSAYPMVPGLAVKCLRNGIKSGNFVGMFSLKGQNTTNFFEHDLTNHVPMLGKYASASALSLLVKLFKSASQWPTMVGLSDFASYTESGAPVAKPLFPFRLVLHPTKQVHNMFPDDPEAKVSWLDQLESLPQGQLYDVYAQKSAADHYMSLAKIAEVWLINSPTRSYFGDAKLFYQHQLMEDDLRLVPSWIPGAQAIVDMQANSDEDWEFPDLPW